MTKSTNYFGRMLCALLLCSGLALTGCTEEPAPVAVSAITLDTNSLELQEGDSQNLTATISPSDADNKKVLWISSNSSVATVAEGVVTAVKAGQATITAKSDDGGKTATCEVTVVAKAILVESVSLDKTSLELKEGEEVSLTATVKPDNATNKNVTWSSSNETVASVIDGKVTALKSGETTITVTTEDGAKTAECKITVKGDPAITSLSELTATTATFAGHLDVPSSDLSFSQVTVYYSNAETFNLNTANKRSTTSFDDEQNFSISLTGLKYNTKYTYCVVVKVKSEEIFGEVKNFTTENVVVEVSVDESSITATTALITGIVTGLSDADKSQIEVGMFYSSEEGKLENGQGTKLTASEIPSDNTLAFDLAELSYGATYYYCSYVKQGSDYIYGEVKTFVVGNVSVILSDAASITATTALITGIVTGLSDVDKSQIDVGIFYSSEDGKLENGQGTKLTASEISLDNAVSFELPGLVPETTYYYCAYVKQGSNYDYGDIKSFTTLKHPYKISCDLNVPSATNLSSSTSANCYIVSEPGLYKFKTVKGNSSTSVGNVASAAILWETFGTSTSPEFCDLISGFCYEDGYIAFKTADTFKEGNAVIAVKDADGNILWSWHIWLTDQPQGQVYYNNAGTMMDRNLGATSATPGDVGALGLLYQWGRKDPFLGSSSIHNNSMAEAKSTITWPLAVSSDASNGTIEYATSNPTTFITYSGNNYDWYYTGDSSTDNTRWTESDKAKSIYDPCPSGWRVPDGGIWSKAGFDDTTYSERNEGMSFSISSPSKTWYPASGYRHYNGGGLYDVGGSGSCWSASPTNYSAYSLIFNGLGGVFPASNNTRAYGYSVRCLQE